MNDKPKQWSVDWEVEVTISMTKTISHGGSNIIEAETAEEAIQQVKDDLSILDVSDLDIDGQIHSTDFDLDDVNVHAFTTTHVREWSH